jgi:lysozyme
MTGANVIVDLSHHNPGLDLAAAQGGGIKAVIHKATNPQGPSMALEEAPAFVTHVQAATGKFPGLYAGHYLKELLGTGTDVGHCWFWLAQYGPTPVVAPNWPAWTMWLYTDGAAGPIPHEVAGIGRYDRDNFNGSADGLASFWKTNSASAPPPVT